MAYAGAAGDTERQMAKALHFEQEGPAMHNADRMAQQDLGSRRTTAGHGAKHGQCFLGPERVRLLACLSGTP